MKKNKGLLSLTFCLLININLFSQEVEKWKKTLIPEINLETNKQVDKGCLVDSIAWHRFYRNELDYFPIENAFDKIEELAKNLKRKETIVFELYYPIVGFDPEIGYNTNLYLAKGRKIKRVEAYDNELKIFNVSAGNHKYILKRLKSKSDCYGTGYSFITIFDDKMDISNVRVILSLELN